MTLGQTPHSPGPWRVKHVFRAPEVLSDDNFIAIVDARRFGPDYVNENGDVSSQARSHNRAIADARLIASAPELLAALKGLADCAGITWLHGFKDELDAAMTTARAAIAKAEGAPGALLDEVV